MKHKICNVKMTHKLGRVAHACISITQEAEAGESQI
jgi:hypothetical protein